VLTPDSSRFWPADRWAPGGPQYSYDKQFVRDWSAGLDWDRTPPGPEVPADVVAATRARYVEVYERLTGREWRSVLYTSRRSRARQRPFTSACVNRAWVRA
jgi:phosphoribosylaminoimidazole-succinocarboxamide synthase